MYLQLYSVVVGYSALNHPRVEIKNYRENHGICSIDEPVHISALWAVVAFGCETLLLGHSMRRELMTSKPSLRHFLAKTSDISEGQPISISIALTRRLPLFYFY
jgi:hypothetical protein